MMSVLKIRSVRGRRYRGKLGSARLAREKRATHSRFSVSPPFGAYHDTRHREMILPHLCILSVLHQYYCKFELKNEEKELL